MTIYSASTIARFWEKVDRRGPDDCWDWLASTYPDGYGHIRISTPRRLVGAHIMSFHIHKGTTFGLFVCHTCDRPICCNPSHLWLGTNRDNQLDAVAKGRQKGRSSPGSTNPRAILNEVDVRNILLMISQGRKNIDIAPHFGVTHSMISRIRRGLSWTHIMGG